MTGATAVSEIVLRELASVLRARRGSLGLEEEMGRTAGWDSLATVNFIVALENAFDHELELDAAERMTSVRAAIEHFEGLGEASR